MKSFAYAREPNRRPLSEQAYVAIRKMITGGALRPHQTVSENELAERLKVSRTPVREAIKRLISDNLLEMTGRGAVRVFAPTPQDLADVYSARAVLEGAAAGLAAPHIDAPLLARLRALSEEASAAVAAGDYDTQARLNGEFHGAIVERCGNRRILDLLRGLDPVVVRYRRLSLAFRVHSERARTEHHDLVQVLETRDPRQIEQVVREHILRGGERVVAAIRALEGSNEA